ncbi:unnamed protein product (macronuclear) [Paramecium tetraurelia]|uniref:DNA mismatch repair proteins mutS family domain-containing protein n=1 Tax=Paramecium tetraurelia TaxID=5888 RepID=A0CEE6_PARTE|nr:uncharacterized protein GSPATT00037600001 [Paramecium tetraurelia]CAK69163.1 unnamed protein product [Paramecium tetraurelia]|eukprot:XP_001436560.1 hypothetical protein (macronuclear) [Paramecium tetraurelia strain d4-2]
MKSQSIYKKSNQIRSTCIKSIEANQEFYLAVIEQQMCVSICAYNEQTGEVFVTQFLDCTTFNITSSTILRFAPKILISIENNEKSMFFKQLEDELNDTLIYFLPLNVLQIKFELNQFSKLVKQLNQLQLCYTALSYTVNQHLNIMINNLPVQFYNIKEVLVFNIQTTLSLDILNQLYKLFKPITNGGKRLLKANLLQPFSTLQMIHIRQQNVKEMLSKDDSTIQALKSHLMKFKQVDTLACQLQSKSNKLQDQLQQIFKIYNFQKDVINFTHYLNDQKLNNIMDIDINGILMSDEFQNIKQQIEQYIDVTLQLNNIEEDTLFFIMLNEKSNNLKQNRLQFIQLRQEINNLFQRLLSCFCLNLKCKKLKSNDNSIKCLKSGYIFELSVNEASRNNINELDIKRIVEKENDSISFIDKNNKKYSILTEKLKDLNNKLNDCTANILSETQLQVNNLYEQMQKLCSWIFSLNCLISQFDIALCIRDYTIQNVSSKQQMIFPQFEYDQFVIKDASYLSSVSLHDVFNKLTISFNQFNIIYDYKECLSEQLKLIGQLIILSQIGCTLPCSQFKQQLLSCLYTHFQKYTIQNLAERQSSFTAEIQSLNNLLVSELSDSLILCDSLAISSSHESNVSFSISFLEAIFKKTHFGLFGTQNSDIMQINDLIQCKCMISNNNQIDYIQQNQLEQILDEEFNLDYKLKLLNKLQQTFDFPSTFCLIFERNFNKQYV